MCARYILRMPCSVGSITVFVLFGAFHECLLHACAQGAQQKNFAISSGTTKCIVGMATVHVYRFMHAVIMHNMKCMATV